MNPARLPFRPSGKWLSCMSLRLVLEIVKRRRIGRAQRAGKTTAFPLVLIDYPSWRMERIAGIDCEPDRAYLIFYGDDAATV